MASRDGLATTNPVGMDIVMAVMPAMGAISGRTQLKNKTGQSHNNGHFLVVDMESMQDVSDLLGAHTQVHYGRVVSWKFCFHHFYVVRFILWPRHLPDFFRVESIIHLKRNMHCAETFDTEMCLRSKIRRTNTFCGSEVSFVFSLFPRTQNVAHLQHGVSCSLCSGSHLTKRFGNLQREKNNQQGLVSWGEN